MAAKKKNPKKKPAGPPAFLFTTLHLYCKAMHDDRASRGAWRHDAHEHRLAITFDPSVGPEIPSDPKCPKCDQAIVV